MAETVKKADIWPEILELCHDMFGWPLTVPFTPNNFFSALILLTLYLETEKLMELLGMLSMNLPGMMSTGYMAPLGLAPGPGPTAAPPSSGTYTTGGGGPEEPPGHEIIWSYDADDDLDWTAGTDTVYYASEMANGNVIITDDGKHRVFEVNPDKTIIHQFGVTGASGNDDSHLAWPKCAIECADGRILIADGNNNRLVRLTSAWIYEDQCTSIEGTTLGVATLAQPTNVSECDNTDILIADSIHNRIIRVDSDYAFVADHGDNIDGGSGDTELNIPNGLCEDSAGHVWVADRMNNRVKELDSTLTYVAKHVAWEDTEGSPRDLYEVTDIQQMTNGDMLICISYRFIVTEVNASFVAQWEYGTFDHYGTGDNQLSWPLSCWQRANGNVLIADYDVPRIIEVD